MANHTIQIKVKVTFFGEYILPFSRFKIAEKLILLMCKKMPIAKMYTSKKIERIYIKDIFKSYKLNTEYGS
jgi:hypothetical protein